MDHFDFPDFYLVGAPKCGTTAMYEYLRLHPEIFLPSTKELIYFGSDLSYPTRLSREQFARFFADRGREERVGTAHSAYMQSRLAAEEIRSARPDADILIMLRNPVEVLQSWHSELLYEAIEDVQDLAAALAAEPDRRRGVGLPRNASNTYVESLYYTDVVAFADQVRRYLDAFSSDHVHVIIHDDLVADPGRVYRGTLEFLGIEPTFQPEFHVLNANKEARSPHLQQYLFHVRGPLRTIARRYVPAPIRHGLVRANTRRVPRAPIAPSLRKQLNELVGEQVSMLGELLDRDLSGWTQE